MTRKGLPDRLRCRHSDSLQFPPVSIRWVVHIDFRDVIHRIFTIDLVLEIIEVWFSHQAKAGS